MRYLFLSACLLFALHGNAQTSSVANDTLHNKVYTYADQMPVAGYDFNKYFLEEYHCPDTSGYAGRVIFEFVVNEDGAISNCKMLKGLGSRVCDTEAFYIIKNMPAWKPGKSKGQCVKVVCKFPVAIAPGY